MYRKYFKLHVYNHFTWSSEKYCMTQSKILCMANHGQYLFSTHMVTALCAILHTNQRLVRDWRHRQNFSMNSLPSCQWILSALKYIVIHTDYIEIHCCPHRNTLLSIWKYTVVIIEIHCCLHRNTLWPRPSRKYLFIWLCGQRYDLTIQTKVWQSGQIWQPYCPNE